MPPISNKGTSLRVETNLGGEIYHDEEITRVYYNRNQQREPRKKAIDEPGLMKTFGHPDSVPETEEFVIDEAMEKAIADDLADKGVKPKAKRTTKKTTTEQN